MGLKIERAAAAKLFAAALELARSDVELPTEWLDFTSALDEAPMTYTPMLGTALLAKSTNRHVSAFALQESESHKGYSARGLAKEILVPQCVLAGIDLRTRGAEPLNNSPFFREARVGTHLGVKPGDRGALQLLCSALAAADFLEGEDAVAALAAFLRTRIALSTVPAVVPVGPGVPTVPELSQRTTAFINADTEGGRRGQAFVTACLDLVFTDVRSAAINDPSRNFPGDVSVVSADQITISAEAKQKPVAASEILQFASRLAERSIGRGIYAALAPTQPPLDVQMLQSTALDRHSLILSVITDVSTLLNGALLWSEYPLEDALAWFPERMAERLHDFGCSHESGQSWAQLFT